MFGKYHEQQKKVLNLVEEFTSSSIQKKVNKEKRLKLFVEEQSGAEVNSTATTVANSTYQQVCDFISEFQDDDASKICESKLSQSEKNVKLSAYLTTIQKEYSDCEAKPKCKSKMTKAQKDNAISILNFLKQLSDELPKNVTLTQDSRKQAARAKAIKIAKEKVELRKKALKDKELEHHKKILEEQKHKKSLHIIEEDETSAEAKKVHIEEMMKEEPVNQNDNSKNEAAEKQKEKIKDDQKAQKEKEAIKEKEALKENDAQKEKEA
jgi:hypothetical protein